MKKFFLFITALCCAVTINATEGALRGKFSISSTKQIQFSKGNLQYQASTDTWRFAENQWDTVGVANKNISESYDGWIDLFGFSTGNKPTERSQYADNYDTEFNHDWGANAISNGGNEPNLWRTLSADEWTYIFHDRTKARHRIGLGKVNGINGLILLPDDWEKPISLEFASFLASGYQWMDAGNDIDRQAGYIVDYGAYTNKYTIEEWRLMEEAGAVFLPAAGVRDYVYNSSGKILYVNYSGHYWTSSKGVHMYFDSNKIYASDRGEPSKYPADGNSVRLVQPYDEHQAIDQITNDQSPKTNKVIKDGRLLIEKNGKIYNATGQEVK